MNFGPEDPTPWGKNKIQEGNETNAGTEASIVVSGPLAAALKPNGAAPEKTHQGHLRLERRSGIFGQDARECSGEQSGVGVGEDERGPQFDDVLMWTVGAGNDAEISQAVDDVCGLFGGGSTGIAIVDKIESEK